MPLYLLKELRHEHGILPARDADADPVSLLHKLIIVQGLCEGGVQPSSKALSDAFLYLSPALLRAELPLYLPEQPLPIAPPQTPGIIALLKEQLRGLPGERAVFAVEKKTPVFRESMLPIGNPLDIHPDSIGKLSLSEILLVPDVDASV